MLCFSSGCQPPASRQVGSCARPSPAASSTPNPNPKPAPLPPPKPAPPGNADLRNHLEARFGAGSATADPRSKLAVDVSIPGCLLCFCHHRAAAPAVTALCCCCRCRPPAAAATPATSIALPLRPPPTLQVYVRRVRKYLGAYFAHLDGQVDAIVFSAGGWVDGAGGRVGGAQERAQAGSAVGCATICWAAAPCCVPCGQAKRSPGCTPTCPSSCQASGRTAPLCVPSS